MEIPKMSKRYHYEEIAKHIKDQIKNDNLKAGDKLPSTKELAERYGVGRSTMREALSALKAIGLIDIRQGEGCTVKKLDATDIELSELTPKLMGTDTIFELIEARKALEVSNAGIAALRRTKQDIVAFEEILSRMALHLGNAEESEKADIEFHLILARATHNSIMVRLFQTISEQMANAIKETRRIYMYADKTVSRKLWKEHEVIFQAIKEKNENKAQIKIKEHLHHVENILNRYLK